MKAFTAYDAAAFWSRVDVRTPGECWPWRGATNSDGYGRHKIAGVTLNAHRVAWDITYPDQPLPDGVLACHRCDNPPCCNPTHLFPGTPADNTRDMIRKGRAKGILKSVDAARAAQAAGAATRHRRTVEDRLPELLAEIARRIESGLPTTYRSVARLDGYWAVRKTLGLRHSQIIEEARKCAA